MKIKVLLFASNYLEPAFDRLNEDVCVIERRIQAGPFGDSFELIPRSTIKVSDLGVLLLRYKPEIVHFSGCGRASEGILLEDDNGSAISIGVNELTGILRTLKDHIRIVLLNVCGSRLYAEAITQVIDYAIVVDGFTEEEVSTSFAAEFYGALAFGLSVNEAFGMAKELTGTTTAVLSVRPGIDAAESFLVQTQRIDELKLAVKRMLEGTASEADRLAIQACVVSGHLVLTEIEDEAQVPSKRQDQFHLMTREGQLQAVLSSAIYQRVNTWLFPVPPGIAPPFYPSVFIGRESALGDIKKLLDPTKACNGKKPIIVVRGWPGVGKTTLVGVISRDPEVANLFPQGVLWTSLEQRPNLLSEMAHWGRALGMDDILRAPTLKEAAVQLAALLRHRRMLLIVDDVWEAAHAIPFIEAMGEHCALLVTTRLTSVAEELAVGEERIYNLPVLTEENALTLLRTLVPTVVAHHEEECRKLILDLECLPLALHVGGRLLKNESKLDWGVTELISELRRGARLIPERAPKDRVEEGGIPTVSALLMKSTDLLEESTRDCFAFLGAFAPKPATFDLAAMQAVWEVEDPRPIVRKLVGHGLLEPVGSGRFQMHRILVDHARSLCSDNGTPSFYFEDHTEDLPKPRSSIINKEGKSKLYQINLQHSIYYEQILRRAYELFKQGGVSITQGLELFDTGWENIQIGYAWAEANAGQDERAAILCSSYVLNSQLLELRQLPLDRIRWLESALAAAKQLNKHGSTARHLIDLGQVYLDIGDIHKSIKFCEQALIITNEGQDHRMQPSLLNIYGSALLENGNTNQAISFFEESLKQSLNLQDRRNEAEAINNLGYAYYLWGDRNRSIVHYEQSVAISRDIGDLRTEMRALSNWGSTHVSMGNAHHAIELFEKQIAISRQIGDRYNEADALSHLGDAYRALENQDRAVECCEQSLLISRELGYWRGECTSLTNLGEIYASIGMIAEATEFYRNSLKIAREFGLQRNVCDNLYYLAKSCTDLGQLEEALQYLEDTLATCRKIANPWVELKVLVELANQNRILKNSETALDYYQQALGIACGTQQISTQAELLFSMGCLARETERLFDAKKYLVASEGIYRQLRSHSADEVAAMLDEIETLLLSEPCLAFFRLAGFELTPVRGTDIYRCEYTRNELKGILPLACYLYFLVDREFDDEQVCTIKERVKENDSNASVVFVVAKNRPTDLGWAQIGILRGPKYAFKLLPIEDTFIAEHLGSGRERIELLKEILKRLGEDHDPYNEREPVAHAFSFFGREALIDLLLRKISDGHPIAIFGLRKMGKSSLLRVLSRRAPFPVVVMSMEKERSLDEFFTYILGEWGGRAKELYEINWQPPTIDSVSSAASFINATQDLLNCIKHRQVDSRLGIFLDEIEHLTPRRDGSGPGLDRYLRLMSALRGLIEEDGHLSLVVSGLNRSINQINSWKGEQNPLFNFFQEVYLSPLEEEDCKHMASNIGLQINLKYDSECLDEIYRFSGGHPFLARQLCSLLYHRRNRKSGQVRLEEIPSAVKEFIYDETTITHLDEGIWQDAGNVSLWGPINANANQSLLLRLATDDVPLTESEILNGPELDARQTSLINLERFHVIYKPEPGCYAIRFGLLNLWLRRRKLGLGGEPWRK